MNAARICRTTVALLAVLLAGSDCGRMRGGSCSVDVDCEEGQVCREAMCRKPCFSGRWVGERVEVQAGKTVKQGDVTACDQRRFRVRYESGVEEQVEDTRLVKKVPPQK